MEISLPAEASLKSFTSALSTVVCAQNRDQLFSQEQKPKTDLERRVVLDLRVAFEECSLEQFGVDEGAQLHPEWSTDLPYCPGNKSLTREAITSSGVALASRVAWKRLFIHNAALSYAGERRV